MNSRGLVDPAVDPAVDSVVGSGPRRLRHDWRAASVRAGWRCPQDWWVPAVEEVLAALVEGRDLVGPCTQLGRARADAGVGLGEAFSDLAALPGVRAGADPLVLALATGWADAACDPATIGVCEDPLTGLTTPAYLRTRLAEGYREAARSGVPVRRSHALVAVAVDPVDGSRLRTMTRLVLVGAGLRDVFSGGETVTGTGPTHAVALTARESALPARIAALGRLLTDRLRQAGSPPARVWMESLPPSLTGAYQLLAELAR